MRGKITDQDLTNYALNDGLDPQERLYVESMMTLSEECRQDIYRNLELSQMLETGFERLYGEAAPGLTAEQRAALIRPQPRRFGFGTFNRAAAILAMAACAAFALANPSLWHIDGQRSLAEVSSQVTHLMASADSGIETYVSISDLGDDMDSLLQTASEAMPQAICTPPTLDSSDFIDFR
jgi:hypothetical protein